MAQNSNITPELEQKVKRFIRLTLKDISVELGEEFDRNFEREAFFNEQWACWKVKYYESRGLRTREGTLRPQHQVRGVSVTNHDSVIFSSSVPYAATRSGSGGLTFHRVAKKGEAPLPDDGGDGGNGSEGGDGGLDENPLG